MDLYRPSNSIASVLYSILGVGLVCVGLHVQRCRGVHVARKWLVWISDWETWEGEMDIASIKSEVLNQD